MMRGSPRGLRTAITLPWRSVRNSSAYGLAQDLTRSCTGRSNPEGLGVSRRLLRKEREASCMKALELVVGVWHFGEHKNHFTPRNKLLKRESAGIACGFALASR